MVSLISANGGYAKYAGLSTDAKPTEGIATGSEFTEVDTAKVYMFNADSSEWVEEYTLGGSGGGGGGAGITAVCKFTAYWDDNVGDEVVECDKSYTELAAILAAADAPVYSIVDYYGIRLYSVVYFTDSTVNQYIGSPVHLLVAREHTVQGPVVETFDAFVGRLSDNTPIILYTPAET